MKLANKFFKLFDYSNAPNRFIKSVALLMNDFVLLVFSFILSCLLTKQSITGFSIEFKMVFLVIVCGQTLILRRFGLYHAILKYASIDFLITVFKAVTVAVVLLVLILYVTQVQVSFSVIFIDWVLTLFLIGGSRFIVRYFFELSVRFRNGRRVLIYGAGDMGALAVRQLMLNKEILYTPVGFIDDAKTKQRGVVRGVKVIGTIDDLEGTIDKYAVEEVVIAIAGIEGDKLGNVVKRCRQKNIICRIIPCFSRFVEMETNIRNIELADLMRRTPRGLDKEAIKEYLYKKKILITGAAGSIGSEIVKQCITYEPESIIALDQSEYGLYSLSEDLGEKNIKYILSDTTNYSQLETLFRFEKPEIIFHAAAYKHVPLLEVNASEAIKNNVISTKNLCKLANDFGAKSFVMISTDKAVKPSSIMGTTKRICELIVQNFNSTSKTTYVSVRFGNVLGSSGSVVPKFIEQIRKGGPVTVTHPDVTRYFMLIDEAVQLVLQSATIGKGGEIFILDMGKPVRISDMAEDLIYLMGRQPHKDIEIKYSGLRQGEKLYEELFNDEIEKNTKFKGIMIGKSRILEWSWLDSKINELIMCSNYESKERIVAIIRELVPEANISGNRES